MSIFFYLRLFIVISLILLYRAMPCLISLAFHQKSCMSQRLMAYRVLDYVLRNIASLITRTASAHVCKSLKCLLFSDNGLIPI